MNKNTFRLRATAILLTIAVTGLICVLIFDSSFAKNTVDYFSFFASLFLIVDGFYKIWRYKDEPYFPNHFIRHSRIIIGTCVFTIHLLQYAYGV